MADNDGCLAFIVIVVAIFLFGAGYVTACDSRSLKEGNVKQWQEKPFCIDESATVMEKTVHNKRCWKVIEVEP